MSDKILIVDDTQFMRKMLADCLIQNGFEVAGEANNGREAIEQYHKLRPDLVMMDINMPEMGGIKAIKEILKIDPAAVILVCTAASQRDSIVEAMKAGAKGYVSKPFQTNQVLEIIRKFTQPHSNENKVEDPETPTEAALPSSGQSEEDQPDHPNEPLIAENAKSAFSPRRNSNLGGFISSVMCNWQEEINGETATFTVVCTESENKVLIEMTDGSQAVKTMQFTIEGFRQLSDWLESHTDRKTAV
jgi:DNA-binding NarL/FixJ family response regulator